MNPDLLEPEVFNNHEDRILTAFGLGGGKAEGYTAHKSVYKIAQEKAKELDIAGIGKINWNINYFGDDSTEIREDIDYGIAQNLMVSKLKIKHGHSIHHKLYTSFDLNRKIMERAPELEKIIGKDSLKEYILELISWYNLEPCCAVNKALLYKKTSGWTDIKKKRDVSFTPTKQNMKKLKRLYKDRIGIPDCDFEKNDSGYKIDFALDRKLFARYDYLELKKNPTLKEIRDNKDKFMEKVKDNDIIYFFISRGLFSVNDISEKFDTVVDGMNSDLNKMQNRYSDMKRNILKIYDTASELGSVSLLITPAGDGISSVELQISDEISDKLNKLSGSPDNFWHLLQPSEIMSLLDCLGYEKLDRIWQGTDNVSFTS